MRIVIALVSLCLAGALAACGDDSESNANGGGGSGGVDSGTGGSSGSAGASGSPSGGSAGAEAGADSGAGGASGSAGSPSDASVTDAPSDVEAGCVSPCSGLGNPAMIEVPVAGSCPFCIDSTEVTNAQYAGFLAAKGSDTSGQPTQCAANTSFTPDGGWPATGKDDFPVTFVDWCDAYAYCAWAGKRLCGKIGGGPNAMNDFVDAQSSQWHSACSKGGTQSMPYGTFYVPSNCNGYASGLGTTVAVASKPDCVGGYPGIFDMSGNVAEWEDSCLADTPNATCRLRGGHWNSTGQDLSCGVNSSTPRNDSGPNVGFRCCAG